MKTAYHILNGDALLHQFPDSVEGTRLVCRECLVEGPVRESSLSQFFEERKTYLNEHYGKEVQLEYKKEVAALFYQILKLPDSAEINLWFEDDLFCQVNLWFCLFLLQKKRASGCSFFGTPSTTHSLCVWKSKSQRIRTLLQTAFAARGSYLLGFSLGGLSKIRFRSLKNSSSRTARQLSFCPRRSSVPYRAFPLRRHRTSKRRTKTNTRRIEHKGI